MHTVGDVAFEDWLEQQLAARNWRPIDLARAAGVAGPTITRILNGDRKLGPETAVAIARALGLSPEYVFRRAGLLPTQIEIEYDPAIQEIVDVLRDMTDEERRSVGAFTLFVYQQRNGSR